MTSDKAPPPTTTTLEEEEVADRRALNSVS
jgi:hypothetical protein